MLEKEKEVFTAQARESGKPENIIEKMIEGRLKKFLKEICVESQPFVKDPQLSVSQLVENSASRSFRSSFDPTMPLLRSCWSNILRLTS